jgi:hypothetical protein
LHFRLLPLKVQESAYSIVAALFFTREQAVPDLSEGGGGTQGLNETLKDIHQGVALHVYDRLKGLL